MVRLHQTKLNRAKKKLMKFGSAEGCVWGTLPWYISMDYRCVVMPVLNFWALKWGYMILVYVFLSWLHAPINNVE